MHYFVCPAPLGQSCPTFWRHVLEELAAGAAVPAKPSPSHPQPAPPHISAHASLQWPYCIVISFVYYCPLRPGPCPCGIPPSSAVLSHLRLGALLLAPFQVLGAFPGEVSTECTYIGGPGAKWVEDSLVSVACAPLICIFPGDKT